MQLVAVILDESLQKSEVLLSTPISYQCFPCQELRRRVSHQRAAYEHSEYDLEQRMLETS
jgi:hypothetical protein